MTLVPMTKFRQ